MNEETLPRKNPIGAQLGIGVKSAALYNPTGGKSEDSGYGWAEVYDDQLAIDLSKLRISSNRCLVDNLARTAGNGKATEVMDDGYYVNESDIEDDESDEDEESSERWKDILLSRLSWDSLSPVIPPNFQYFKEVQLQRDNMYDVKSKLSSTHDFVPGSLIKDLSRSDLISNKQPEVQLKAKFEPSYDPTVGSLFVTGEVQTVPDLRNAIRPHRIMIYCSGRVNSILNIAVVDEKRNNSAESFDQIKSSVSIEMMSTIKSIKISNLSAMLGRKSDLIGVMTESAFHLIKIENISCQNEIRTSLCEPLPFKDFGDFPLADFAFNPWDLRQFAVVDIKGNFGLGQIPKSFKIGSKCRLSSDSFGTIFDPEELSNWRRVEWSSSFTRLLVMDRSKVMELDLAQEWQLEVVQAKTWSRILDYHRLDDDYGILLTSKEIIMVGTKQSNEQVTREVSWKHDLNPEDTTLRLCVQTARLGEKKLLLVCIFSRNHPQIYVHCFSLNASEIISKSATTAVLLQVPRIAGGLKGMSIYDRIGDEDAELSTTDSQPSMQLSMYVSENGSKKFWHYVVTNDDLPINQDQIGRNPTSTRASALDKNDHLILPRNTPNLIDQIFQSTLAATDPERDPATESEIFQTYGYRLSEAINSVISTWEDSEEPLAHLQSPIRDLTVVPKDIWNLSEFTSLLQQLSQHYTDQGLAFTNFKMVSSLLLREPAEDLDIFYSKLLQCWDLVTSNSEVLTRGVTRDVIMSTLHFCRPSLYKRAEEKLCESFSGSYREIIDSWAEEDSSNATNEDISTAFSQSQLFQGSQSQIPTIKASQSRSSKRTKRAGLTSGRVSKITHSQPLFNRETMAAPPLLSSTQPSSALPETMTPAFSLMQAAGSASQSQSSQRSKRKKKKVGGFG